jgi:hypothetical protein
MARAMDVWAEGRTMMVGVVPWPCRVTETKGRVRAREWEKRG